MSSNWRIAPVFLALLLLLGCAKSEPASPALWQVEGPSGEKAWLFGTIHALPRAYAWRSPRIEAALDDADRLVVEVAALDNDAATARTFAELARSPGLAPLAARIPLEDRPRLASDMAAGGLAPDALDPLETWAAAIALEQAAASNARIDSGRGVDRALLRSWRGPIEEFEGARAQLSIFDRLPEAQQRALLLAVIHGEDGGGESDVLVRAWAKGDLDTIAREVNGEFLADPQLREALLTGRNRAWTDKLDAALKGGAHHFVAVGAAHLVGPEGLPALLAARGYRVTRLQ